MPQMADAVPASCGRRTPMRSMTRPACTENSVGNSASSERIKPTVNGEAFRLSANSDRLTRTPANAACRETASNTAR